MFKIYIYVKNLESLEKFLFVKVWNLELMSSHVDGIYNIKKKEKKRKALSPLEWLFDQALDMTNGPVHICSPRNTC